MVSYGCNGVFTLSDTDTKTLHRDRYQHRYLFGSLPICWYLYLSQYLSVSMSGSVNVPLDFTDIKNQFFW